MGDDRSEILQGTLDLMVLKTLDAMGPMTATASRSASSRLPRTL